MKTVLGAFVGLLLVVPNFAHAVSISEIMYDVAGTDTGREWIEVRNDSTADIDLSTWKLFEANVAHKITALGSSILPAGGFAILADSPDKFMADNAGFSGLVFDSVFSLGNTGETIALRDSSDATVDSVSYEGAWGAAGDGNSLQKKDGAWIAAAPTPGSAPSGAVNAPTASETQQQPAADSTASNHQEEFSAHSSQIPATISYEEPEIVVTAGRPRLGFVGSPLSFEAKIKSVKNIPVSSRATYAWSMGDGMMENGQFISHAYEFPGDYIVLLNAEQAGASAVSKVSVRIVVPHIALRSRAEYVEIENTDSHELNLGGFSVETGGTKFRVPDDTLVLPKAVLRLSLSKMHMGYGNKVAIKNPAGELLAQVEAPSEIVTSTDTLISLPPGVDEKTLREKLKLSLGE